MRVGFLPLLAVAFIILRLCEVIDWSWWWVLAPIWGPLAIAAMCFMLLGVIAVIAEKNR